MAYVSPNFKTKKAFKEAFQSGKRISVFSPGFYPCEREGREYIEGPYSPAPHKWAASVLIEDGIVIKILS
jgi:hypothetical protein